MMLNDDILVDTAPTNLDNKSDYSVLTPGIYYPPHPTHKKFRKKARRRNQRVIMKNGDFNIDQPKSRCTFSFVTNWFITLVEARWRWTLLYGFMAFIGDWVFFACIYWLIALIHGDLREENLPPYQNSTDWIPCIVNNYGFPSTFLLSIEIHSTGAYGKRALTMECPEAVFTLCIQNILSLIFESLIVGILFAKLIKPKNRTQSIEFTKNAIVNLRDKKLCLLFRIGDVRKSRILNINPSLFITRFDKDNVVDEFDQKELKCKIDECESNFFLWPVSVIHVIDEKSPLYKVSAADLLCSKIEVLVVFEGMIESTGQLVQARTSFTENEIVWGHRFDSMVTFNEEKRVYDVDYSKLSSTVKVDTPLCSAWELDCIVKVIESQSSLAISEEEFMCKENVHR